MLNLSGNKTNIKNVKLFFFITTIIVLKEHEAHFSQNLRTKFEEQRQP